MVGTRFQIAVGFNLEVNQAVTGDLVQHVFEETDGCIDFCFSGAIKIDCNRYFALTSLTNNCCYASFVF